MVAVARGSHYEELKCCVCHQQLRPGDRILPSFKGGKPRAMHAHACTRPRVPVVAIEAIEAQSLAQRPPAASA